MTSQEARLDTAIAAAADALLSVCAVQTGMDADAAIRRAMRAIADVMSKAAKEHGVDKHQPPPLCPVFNPEDDTQNCWEPDGHKGKHSWQVTEKKFEPWLG